MKMKSEDFSYLKNIVERKVAALGPAHRDEYKREGHSHKRYRWDILWLCKMNDFVCNTLYRYLNDDHIDTALRSILGGDYPETPDSAKGATSPEGTNPTA